MAGHEIGHNLGRSHAPCGGAGGPDPNYPYGGASIGQYGTDIQGNNVAFYSPTSHVDMMSYCAPEWISDYTYEALYNDQRNYGFAPPAQKSERLVIRATFGANSLKLAPIYAFDVYDSHVPVNSDVIAELVDNTGSIIASYPITVREAEEEGLSGRSVLGDVPLPAVPVATLRLVENGMVLAERPLTDSQNTLATTVSLTQDSESVTLNWSLPNVPAIIRYTTDEGETWTTFGLDVMGGTYSVPMEMLMGDGRFQIILANSNTPAILAVDYTLP